MLPTHSQNISKGEVKTTINQKGDTLIVMRLDDAKPILMDLLDYELIDSLLAEYQKRDSIQDTIIALKVKKIEALQQKSDNQEQQKKNLENIIKNKDEEIWYKDDIIEQQRREIKKQKTFKIVGMITTGILIIISLLSN